MNAGADARLRMKLTIAADETPDLFRALAAVKDARRRTRRLKDLATKGLMVERTAGGLPVTGQPDPGRDRDQAQERPPNLPPGVSGASFAEAWGAEGA
jgi:hypothetical protein